MRAIIYNRVLLFLGLLGMFIAGNLSLAKLMNVVLPCGAGSSCETVTNDPSSMLFGVIPIAYLGFGAYLVLTVLAILRGLPKSPHYATSVLAGYVITAIGAVISIALQVYSLLIIGALCKWCLASAVTMTASLVAYALFYQSLQEKDPQELLDARGRSSGADFLMSTSMCGVALIAIAVSGYQLRFADNSKGVTVVMPKDFPIIPSDPKIYGDPKSPVKVIEFADLNCPSCKVYSPKLKDFVRQHPGEICVIFRHLPLPMHKTSVLAAAIDEFAYEKGKFWDYTLAVMANKEEIKDPNDLFLIAAQQGLDVNDLRRRLADDKDPLYSRLNEDINAAGKLGLSATPTFIVFLPKQPPKSFSGAGMFDAFGQRPYADYLGKKS